MSFWLNKRVGGSILHKIGLRVLVINNEESDSDCLVFPEQVQCVVGHLNLEFMGIKDKTRFLEPHQTKQTCLRVSFAFASLHASQMSLATHRQVRSALLAYDLAFWATYCLPLLEYRPTRIELRCINGMIIVLKPGPTVGVPIWQRRGRTSIRQSDDSGEFCEGLLCSIGCNAG